MSKSVKSELVFVVLGAPKRSGDPMPATVTQYPDDTRGPSYQRLSEDEYEQMGPDETAIWEATWLEGEYRLSQRVDDGDAPSHVSSTVEFDESEIPF